MATRDRYGSSSTTTAPAYPPMLERIFERFYTDRPDQGSELALGFPSRAKLSGHGGRISALNRIGPPGADGLTPVLGARFLIFLPKAR